MPKGARSYRVGIIGKDARTDSLAGRCVERDDVSLFTLSQFRIPGLVEKSVDLREVPSLEDCESITKWAGDVQPDFVIIGPEEPLAAGVVDVLEGLGIKCFGPRQSLARIESSKIWARELVRDHRIPGNPDFWVFDDPQSLRIHVSTMSEFVVKPDGLTGGKGVRLFPEHFVTVEEAASYGSECIADGGRVLIEECLEGEEFSLQTITDGETWIHCPVVQDHKRAYANDTGPNTGGMGSYSCSDHSLPFLTSDDIRSAQAINEQVIAALHRETGEPYRGVLYGGFIATKDGVRLIEYNCRFGDPEVLNIMPIMEADFLEVATAVADGTLANVPVRFAESSTVCKYIVPEGYPNGGGAGDPVDVPKRVFELDGVHVYWAASELQDDGITVKMTGSRALAVVGVGGTVSEAEKLAEEAAQMIGVASTEAGGKVRHREDIGRAPMLEARVRHMDAINASAHVPA